MCKEKPFLLCYFSGLSGPNSDLSPRSSLVPSSLSCAERGVVMEFLYMCSAPPDRDIGDMGHRWSSRFPRSGTASGPSNQAESWPAPQGRHASNWANSAKQPRLDHLDLGDLMGRGQDSPGSLGAASTTWGVKQGVCGFRQILRSGHLHPRARECALRRNKTICKDQAFRRGELSPLGQPSFVGGGLGLRRGASIYGVLNSTGIPRPGLPLAPSKDP